MSQRAINRSRDVRENTAFCQVVYDRADDLGRVPPPSIVLGFKVTMGGLPEILLLALLGVVVMLSSAVSSRTLADFLRASA